MSVEYGWAIQKSFFAETSQDSNFLSRCSGVFIINFEHVIAHWDVLSNSSYSA